MFLSTGGGTLEDVERAVDAILAAERAALRDAVHRLVPVRGRGAQPRRDRDATASASPISSSGSRTTRTGSRWPSSATCSARASSRSTSRLNHAWKGTDHAFSLMPDGMRRLVRDLHRVPDAARRRREAPARRARSGPLEKMGKKLVATRDLPVGHVLDGGRPRRRGPRPTAASRPTSSTTCSGGGSRGRSSVDQALVDGRRRASRRARRRSRSVTSLSEIRLVVFDFDGVFSDNRVWTNDRGEESVACFRGDSAGLRRLDEVGVDYFILTSETNDAVPARARKIRIECVQGVEDKLPGSSRGARAARRLARRDGVRRQRHQRRRVPRRGRAARRAGRRVGRGRCRSRAWC